MPDGTDEKVTYTVKMFTEALHEFTTWDQVKTYFANQPTAIRTETYEKFQNDIDLHQSNAEAEAERVTELQARLAELKTAAGDS